MRLITGVQRQTVVDLLYVTKDLSTIVLIIDLRLPIKGTILLYIIYEYICITLTGRDSDIAKDDIENGLWLWCFNNISVMSCR
jgi:hypothetical protein